MVTVGTNVLEELPGMCPEDEGSRCLQNVDTNLPNDTSVRSQKTIIYIDML
jgi:hypothetical protein